MVAVSFAWLKKQDAATRAQALIHAVLEGRRGCPSRQSITPFALVIIGDLP